MRLKNSLLALLAITLVFTACKKDDEKEEPNNNTPELMIPTSYDSTAYQANIEGVKNIRTQMDALVTEIKKGRTGTVLTASGINTIYTAGTPSLQSITSTFYTGALAGSNGWFEEVAKASGNTFHPDSPATVNGGTYSGFLFDENGFEPEQLIEKGLFGSALINYAAGLISNNPTQQNIDQAIYVYGASAHFVSSNTAAKYGSNTDKYLSSYMARRDKNDGNGLYSQMKNNFIKLQAAVKGGSAYNTQRDEAVAAIKLAWEKANAATIINYCYSSVSKLSATTVTDADRAGSLHSIGECIGFAYGWKTLSFKKITDAQVDEVLELLNANMNGTGKPSKFITDRVNEVNKLQLVINKLQSIYGFSNADLEDFKKNWVAEQSR